MHESCRGEWRQGIGIRSPWLLDVYKVHKWHKKLDANKLSSFVEECSADAMDGDNGVDQPPVVLAFLKLSDPRLESGAARGNPEYE